ncbi:MAG TPA: acyl-CoA dehydrogenase family protein [Solirubrobacteraceae bacterium]|nr:acyl-CoA dehydrogenase family protein [Solirubrobacteraceae bacterium]
MRLDLDAPLTLEAIAAIAADATAVDAEGRFPRAGIDELARAGLLGLGLPQSLGGAGGGPLEFVEVVEQVAAACASTGMVYVMHVVGGQTLLAGAGGADATGPQREALEAMAAGRHLTTLAYSERGSRGHFWAQVSHAVEDGDGLVVDADKTWATSAGHVDSYVLAVGAPNTDDPLSTELYLVPSDADGLTVPSHFDGLGMRGNASAPLRVRGLRLSQEQRLGDEGSGFGLMMTATLPWFALGSAACSVGIAAAALDAAIAHAKGARLDHDAASLAQVPGVRARLAYARVRLRESRALLHEVAGAVAGDDPSAQEGVLAVKASAAEMAIEVSDLAMRVGGGAAYSKQGPLERHLRDARAAAVMAPTTELLHDFLGKAITGQELF